MVKFTAIFTSADTLLQYVKHIRWAHRFLSLDDGSWHTPALQQVVRGIKKTSAGAKPKVALASRQVKEMVKEALRDGEMETAAILAIARHFLLRVPSEAVPLQWLGEHSKIKLSETECTITLSRRKNRNKPKDMTRRCCCAASGRLLCSVHWFQELNKRIAGGRVFSLTVNHLARKVKHLAERVGVPNAQYCGTHALRRCMAQDILDLEGSLPALLKAGDWSSSAYLRYLRSSQTDDLAVAQATIYLSESEDE